MGQGTESVLELVDRLEHVAPQVEAFSSHRLGAELLRKAAAELRRLAPLDPDIDAVRGEG